MYKYIYVNEVINHQTQLGALPCHEQIVIVMTSLRRLNLAYVDGH